MSLSSSLMLPMLPQFIYLLTFTATTVHSQKTISSAAELVEFSKAVRDGDIHLGTTVTLAKDIDLSGVDFTPIGRYEAGTSVSFRGVFEGNGHIIENMNVTTSTSIYAGLFGYTVGCTIKDVIIGSSCLVTNNVNGIYAYAGGIIGYADAGTGVGETAILNCVNMGTITGSGTKSRVGGIAGVLYAIRSPAKIMNCVNLGDIVYSGTAVTEVYIGGIAGWVILENEYNVSSIRNCVNMGTITTSSPATYVGAIAGMSSSYKNGLNVVRNSYWMSGTGLQGYNGNADTSNNEGFGSNCILSTGGSLVDALNNYVDSQSSYDLRKWGAVTFDTNGGSTVGARMTMFVMLGTPDTPTKVEGAFDGWYTDPAFKTEFNMATRYGSGVGASLYAKWVMNQYSVVFDFGNGTRTEEIVLEYDEAITYPKNPENMEGHTFNGWDKNITNMPAENITITAMWKANNYTVAFDFGNGTTIEEIVSFNGTVIYPKNLVMEGHTFNGWDKNITIMLAENITITAMWKANNYTVTFDFENGTAIEEIVPFNGTITHPKNLVMEGYTFNGWDKNITNMPAQNITITAVWKEIPTEYVEIVFNKKGMTEDEVREFISKYAQNDNYVIKTFESENDETKVIIKFNDASEAEEFVEGLETSSEIVNAGYLGGYFLSFSKRILMTFHIIIALCII